MTQRPLGAITRGTTNPNRLRRTDNWIAAHFGALLRRAIPPSAAPTSAAAPLAAAPLAAAPLVVDLGFGASPVTTVELRSRLVAAAGRRVRVIGLEIDPVRVELARTSADPPGLDFALGGFELAGLRPVLVRAMNVLRQYDESQVGPAWAAMTAALAPGGMIVEGTCDELGRLGSWVALDASGPRSLTLAARLASLDRPSDIAERLPKALIHHNTSGTRVHDLFQALDAAWRNAAPYAVFGPRQRWIRSIETLRTAGWPILDRPTRWRLGEVTVAWSAISP